MFVNQLGMTIFGLALSASTGQNNTLFLISSIFAILFYLTLLYTMTWDIGFEEKTRISGNRLQYKPMKGFFISLCANILNLLLGILITVGFYAATSYTTNSAGFISPSAPEFFVNLYGIAKGIAILLEGMYAGVINLLFKNSPWIYIVITLPSMLVCTVAYIMGVKGKHFTKLLGPEKKKD